MPSADNPQNSLSYNVPSTNLTPPKIINMQPSQLHKKTYNYKNISRDKLSGFSKFTAKENSRILSHQTVITTSLVNDIALKKNMVKIICKIKTDAKIYKNDL